MSEPSTTAGAFEPDWEALLLPFIDQASQLRHVVNKQTASAIIAEYQRQATAAGLVMVPERALWTIFDKAREYYHFWREDDIADRDAIAAVLGVKPEPAPGGDG